MTSDLVKRLRYADQDLDHGNIAKVKSACWEAHERRDMFIERSNLPNDNEDISIASVVPEEDESVINKILQSPTGTGDGRSGWVWVRLANGDLILGVFPQGDTYTDVEQRAP